MTVRVRTPKLRGGRVTVALDARAANGATASITKKR